MGYRLSRIAGVLVLATAVAACGSNTTPGIHPEIRSLTDSFEFQVTAVTDYSGTLTYNWTNTGTTATVNQATTVSSGTVTLVLTDGAGHQVYSRALSDNGTFPSASGVSGTWTVRVVFANASGTLNFRAQKTT